MVRPAVILVALGRRIASAFACMLATVTVVVLCYAVLWLEFDLQANFGLIVGIAAGIGGSLGALFPELGRLALLLARDFVRNFILWGGHH